MYGADYATKGLHGQHAPGDLQPGFCAHMGQGDTWRDFSYVETIKKSPLDKILD
jgi:hypothetical protein